ncbi:MAG: efflux RND transporter periplasmic adaptor subunit [Gemmatimonadaceae bacterium]|nr:efflux RND transporter periplasmic adaptor subunit [Gemmatimonadaceae bacterium]
MIASRMSYRSCSTRRHPAPIPPTNRSSMGRLVCLPFLLALSGVGCGGEAAPSADMNGAATTAAEASASVAKDQHGPTEVVVLDTAGVRLAGIEFDTASTVTTSGLAVTGTITYDANRVSHIGAWTEGRVVALRVPLGAQVGAGQMLALLESPAVGQIRAQERESEELRGIARENFAREQRLAAQGISSRKELLDAEAELRRTEAALRSAEAQLAALGAGHGSGGQFGLAAPFAGVVVARDASIGEMASPTDTLFTVADLSRVWIELNVFERDLARVTVGQSVAVSVTAYVGRKFPGRIVYLGAALDPLSRTVPARVEILNGDRALKPGMFASASIQVGEGGTPVVVVSRDAVQEVGGRAVVFVPGIRRGEFRTVAVEVGEPVGNNRVTIRSGLAAGARVVVAGAFALRSELAKSEIGEGGR